MDEDGTLVEMAFDSRYIERVPKEQVYDCYYFCSTSMVILCWINTSNMDSYRVSVVCLIDMTLFMIRVVPLPFNQCQESCLLGSTRV